MPIPDTPAPDANEPAAPVVFVHIPKAAGTALKELLIRVYTGRPALLFTPGDGLLDRFRALPPAQRATCAVLCGHAPFGVHDAYDGAGVTPSVITVLREPVARVRSLYRYIFREPAHAKHAEFTADRPTVAQVYADADFAPFDNHQVRYLAGNEAHARPFGSITRDDLGAAKRNLEHGCRAFGLQERMDESLRWFERELAWPRLGLKPLNVTPRGVEAPGIRPADSDAISAHNTLDAELYAFACDLFDRKTRA